MTETQLGNQSLECDTNKGECNKNFYKYINDKRIRNTQIVYE